MIHFLASQPKGSCLLNARSCCLAALCGLFMGHNLGVLRVLGISADWTEPPGVVVGATRRTKSPLRSSKCYVLWKFDSPCVRKIADEETCDDHGQNLGLRAAPGVILPHFLAKGKTNEQQWSTMVHLLINATFSNTTLDRASAWPSLWHSLRHSHHVCIRPITSNTSHTDLDLNPISSHRLSNSHRFRGGNTE